MNRADLLQEAIAEGIRLVRSQTDAEIIRQARFEEREGRILVFCPRRRLERERPASIEDMGLLRELVDEGAKVHGFLDAVIIQP